jgi:hypothetical protein
LSSTVLFCIQLVLLAYSGSQQLMKLLESDSGMSLTWVLLWLAFLVMNLLLSIQAYRSKRVTENLQLIIMYAALIGMCLSWLGVMFYRNTLTFNLYDLFNTLFAAISTMAVFMVARHLEWYENRPTLSEITQHPWTRTALALLYKAVPQVTLTVQILAGESQAVSGAMILIGHVSIIMRFIQALLSMRKAGYNQNIVAILISEGGNELTWITFTVVWLNG